MEHFAQGIVAGFAVSATIPFMYYFNKAALETLFAVNKAIGKALVRVLIPHETRYDDLKHTCNNDDDDDDNAVDCKSFVCCNNCESTELKLKPKYTSPCLTTSS